MYHARKATVRKDLKKARLTKFMEVHQIYDINRRMHSRPLTSIVMAMTRLREYNDGLEVSLTSVRTGESFEGRDFLRFLTIGGKVFRMGERVEVRVWGEYPEDKLRREMEKVERIFSFKDDSPTLQEELYKSRYGVYPKNSQ